MSNRRPSNTRDRGMTLIELIVVVTLVGVIAVVLAGAFTVIARTNPSNSTRIDDARTMLGITSYLPDDVNSTPSSGYDFSKNAASGCPGTTDPGVSLVRLQWVELSTTYVANYRYEAADEDYVVARYSCTLPSGATTRQVLTTGLPAIDETTWNPGEVPAVVEPILFNSATVGLTMELTMASGERYTVLGQTNNPRETLPPAPGGGAGGGAGPTNIAPTATDVDVEVQPGVPKDAGLDAHDPDTDPLLATLSIVNLTTASGTWTVSLTGLSVTITAPATALPGEEVTFAYSVDDSRGGTATAHVRAVVGVMQANTPPVATDASQTIDELTTTSVIVAIDDVDGDALNVTLETVDPSVTVSVVSVTGSAVEFEVYSNGASTTPQFTYTVSDGAAVDMGTVSLTVVKCAVTGGSPLATTVDRRNGNADHKRTLDAAVTFTFTYSGPCVGRLTLEFRRDLRSGGVVQQAVVACAGGSCAHTFAKHDGDWYPPNGNVATTHTWAHALKLDNSTTVQTVNMTIKGI